MSRVGKQPVTLPASVKSRLEGNAVFIEGPKGKLQFTLGKGVSAAMVDGKIQVSALSEDSQTRSNFGTARALINNMVLGVTTGWKRSLELSGVGFTAKVTGKELVLNVGFSHEVRLEIPESVKCVVSKTTIEIEGPDRQVLGSFASTIRKVQPPEPYLGKGIRYTEEKVRRKAGKTGKK